MLERVVFFTAHSAADLFLYRIPRWVHHLLVKLPVTLWQLIAGRRPLTYAPHNERHITVVTSRKEPAKGEGLLKRFGLHRNMLYDGPLYSEHIHTILGNTRPSCRVAYERELLTADDGNPICLDWLKVRQGTAAKGVILVLPGIGNYSQTPYLQRLARKAVSQGFHCCLLTPRGMGSAPLTQPRLTCITFTEDLRMVMRCCLTRSKLRAHFGHELPLFFVGYSAGGSTILKAVVEEFEEFKVDPSRYPGGFPVEALVSMNSPYNMFRHAETIERCPFFYQKPMIESMRKYALKHSHIIINGLPGLPTLKDKAELVDRLQRLKNANDFNERLVAPHFGYTEGAAGYYKDAAALKWLERMDASLPVVCLAARTDPITGVSHTEEEWQALVDAHPNIIYVETPVGGHLAYLPGPIDALKGQAEFLIDFPLHVVQHATCSGKDKDA